MYRAPRLNPELMNSQLNEMRAANATSLWIIGSSPELYRRLSAVRETLNAIVIQPDGTCDAGALPPHTLELIARIIRIRNVSCVIVCGHADDAAQDSPPEQHPPGSGMRIYQQLLHRIRARTELQRRAQERVVTRLDQISSHAEVAYAMALRSISPSGMFYISESDTFLHFDRSANQFEPSTGLPGLDY